MKKYLIAALASIIASVAPIPKAVAEPPKESQNLESRVQEIKRANNKATKGSKVSTHYQIKDSQENPVSNHKITIEYNGKQYSIKTDENGIFTVSLNAKNTSEEIRVIDPPNNIDERKKIELSDIVEKEITRSMRFIQISEKTAGLLGLYLSGNTEYNCEISIRGDYVSVILSNIKGKGVGVKLEALKLKAHEGSEIKRFTHQHYGFKLSSLTHEERTQFAQFIANSPFSQAVSLYNEGWLKNKKESIEKSIENPEFPLKDRFYFLSEGESIDGVQEGNLPSTKLKLKRSASVSSYDIKYENNISGTGITISGETSSDLKDTVQVKIRGEHLKIKGDDWGFKLTYEVAKGDEIETTDYFVNAKILADIFEKEDDISQRLEKIEKTIFDKANKKRIFFEKRKIKIKRIDENSKDTNINAVLGMFSEEEKLALVYGEDQVIESGFISAGKEYIQEQQEESPFYFSPKNIDTVLSQATSSISLLKVTHEKEGRQVFVDGKYVGDTPISIDLTKGKHKVKINNKEKEVTLENDLENIFFFDERERKEVSILVKRKDAGVALYTIKEGKLKLEEMLQSIDIDNTTFSRNGRCMIIETNSPWGEGRYAQNVKKYHMVDLANKTIILVPGSEGALIPGAITFPIYKPGTDYKGEPTTKQYIGLYTVKTIIPSDDGNWLLINNSKLINVSKWKESMENRKFEMKLDSLKNIDEEDENLDSEMKAMWEDSTVVYFSKNKESYDVVTYNPVTGERVRTKHRTLEELKRAFNDKYKNQTPISDFTKSKYWLNKEEFMMADQNKLMIYLARNNTLGETIEVEEGSIKAVFVDTKKEKLTKK